MSRSCCVRMLAQGGNAAHQRAAPSGSVWIFFDFSRQKKSGWMGDFGLTAIAASGTGPPGSEQKISHAAAILSLPSRHKYCESVGTVLQLVVD